LRRARQSDDWRFHAAQQACPLSSVSVAGRAFALDALRVAMQPDDVREVIDIRVHHPDIGASDEGARARVTFTALDAALGEDAVERWLGTVEPSVEPTDSASTLAELAREVSALAGRATGIRWEVVRGEVDNKPMTATINRALKRLDHLALQLHVRVDIDMAKPNELGLCTSDEALALEALEAELSSRLGVHGVVCARETHSGHRIIHLHASAQAGALIDAWKRTANREVAVLSSPDPHWEVLRRWA
jgi:hypothetical protein